MVKAVNRTFLKGQDKIFLKGQDSEQRKIWPAFRLVPSFRINTTEMRNGRAEQPIQKWNKRPWFVSSAVRRNLRKANSNRRSNRRNCSELWTTTFQCKCRKSLQLLDRRQRLNTSAVPVLQSEKQWKRGMKWKNRNSRHKWTVSSPNRRCLHLQLNFKLTRRWSPLLSSFFLILRDHRLLFRWIGWSISYFSSVFASSNNRWWTVAWRWAIRTGVVQKYLHGRRLKVKVAALFLTIFVSSIPTIPCPKVIRQQ